MVPGVLPGREALPMDGIDLQAVVPAFHGGDAIVVPFFVHARHETMSLQEAAIGVEDDTSGVLAPSEGHAQGVAGELGCHPFGHRPADHLTGVEVEHHSKIEPPLVRG